jgi:hypothetical protein
VRKSEVKAVLALPSPDIYGRLLKSANFMKLYYVAACEINEMAVSRNLHFAFQL